jgi:hypothetical protein
LLISNESVPPGTPTNGVWPSMAKSLSSVALNEIVSSALNKNV